MRLLSTIFVFTLLSGLVGLVQVKANDAESFLNTYSPSDRNEDYDRDGSTEQRNDRVDILKTIPVVIHEAKKIELPQLIIALDSSVLPLPTHGPLRLSTYVLSIFRPPITLA